MGLGVRRMGSLRGGVLKGEGGGSPDLGCLHVEGGRCVSG